VEPGRGLEELGHQGLAFRWVDWAGLWTHARVQNYHGWLSPTNASPSGAPDLDPLKVVDCADDAELSEEPDVACEAIETALGLIVEHLVPHQEAFAPIE
jgi:hypothetical protein